MKTLTLPLKKKWFDLIKAGIKKEEYREASCYWTSRLLKYSLGEICVAATKSAHFMTHFEDFVKSLVNSGEWVKHFDSLVFTLGYPKADDTERRLEFKNPKIRIGEGRPEWGAKPGKLYFVITWEE
jgi:hypothetical protein